MKKVTKKRIRSTAELIAWGIVFFSSALLVSFVVVKSYGAYVYSGASFDPDFALKRQAVKEGGILYRDAYDRNKLKFIK